MHNIYNIHTFYVYLLHVSMLCATSSGWTNMPVPRKANDIYGMVIYGFSSVAYMPGTLCISNVFKIPTVVQGSWENYIMRSLIICTLYQILFGWSHREWEGQGTQHFWGRVEGIRDFGWGNLRERSHLEDPGTDASIILRWIFRKCDVGVWSGSKWLRISTSDGHLWMR